ncbi:uncharacterized protein LOC116337244 [Contarinia nasturtii]|uniref:uncharacterized protein LOC116337244 n=1 Tax=Contarinia nasturtii TaxID=265458 RepID=UPI0012D46792|nr:uncharacterized protein LOC116337244 [Contarinia nasturtii]
MDPDQNQRSNVNFLIKAASLLPNANFAHKLLKSYYLTKCKKLVHSNPNQSKTQLNEEEMCRKCSSPWWDTNYSLSIAPVKVTKRKAQKLQKQIDDKSKRKGPLAKKLSKKLNNIVTIKCDLCKNKNKVILYKKSVLESKLQKSETTQTKRQSELIVTPQQPSSSKKKRKKDKNAGLLYTLKKDEGKTAKKIINLCEQTQTLNIQKKSVVAAAHTNQPNKNSQKNGHHTGNKNSNQKGKGPKVKSKKNISQPPPKRNNLLLLANALKAKSTSTPNSHTDKLKQLLR